MKIYNNREEWMLAALPLFAKHFKAAGYEIPTVKLSCGWPHKGGTSEKKRCIGQAWAPEASSDGVAQIFISPWLADAVEPQGVLATLVHEICHAVVGNINKHNKVFGKCARAVGLEGKLTATYAGEKLIAECKAWMEILGEYPHAKLDLTKAPTKKQSTRMIKMECDQCGYVCRTSKKWLEEVGPAHCPKHGEMTVELPTEGDGDEEESE